MVQFGNCLRLKFDVWYECSSFKFIGNDYLILSIRCSWREWEAPFLRNLNVIALKLLNLAHGQIHRNLANLSTINYWSRLHSFPWIVLWKKLWRHHSFWSLKRSLKRRHFKFFVTSNFKKYLLFVISKLILIIKDK